LSVVSCPFAPPVQGVSPLLVPPSSFFFLASLLSPLLVPLSSFVFPAYVGS
jgi:hypothetical protein